MAQQEILLPKMGESVAEATIIKWLVEEGQSVEADDPIVEIATDKVDSEVPVPEDGVIAKILVQEGDVVQVGQPIAVLVAEGETAEVVAAPAPAADAAAPVPAHGANGTVAAPAAVAEAATATLTDSILKNGPSGRFYSPLVRNIAKQEGIAMAELEGIPGTGKEGRVTKRDMLAYVENRGTASAPAAAPVPAAKAAPAAKPAPKPASIHVGTNDEIVEMDRMRKLIADHMVMSKATSPHVTSFVEADVTNLVMWRKSTSVRSTTAKAKNSLLPPCSLRP